MNPRAVRVLYVHNTADLYGASRSLLRLLSALDRTRFEPLVCLPAEGPLAGRVRKLRVPVFIFPALSVIERNVFLSWRLPFFLLSAPLSVLGLWRLIKRERIDLVHTNVGVILSSGPAALLARVPHVWHLRDWFQEFRWLWPVYSAWMLWISDCVIAVSEAIAGQFTERGKIVVIRNGFDPAEFAVKPDAGLEFRRSQRLGDGPVIGCVGRIKIGRKGQEVLIRAVARLKQRGLFPRCIIVGAPFQGFEPHLAELTALTVSLQVQDQILFVGELDDPRPAYAAMDIFVLPSALPEPFGGVVMEAMCMRLPVVATNIGGSTEQVVEGETGYLVPPHDDAALADRLALLLGDAALRQRLGEAGRRRVVESFSLSGAVQKIEAIYLKISDTSSPRPPVDRKSPLSECEI